MKLIAALAISLTLTRTSLPGPIGPSADEVLARLEAENNRRRTQLTEYSGSRQYTMQNSRFGQQAAASVLMNYRQTQGAHFTVLARSGSGKLGGIIDQVLASETDASLPDENPHHQISSGNYRVRLLGTEVAGGRTCYVLELSPKIKSRFLIVGKAWVDTASYAVVRVEGQYAATVSILVGAPRMTEDYVEVEGFWLPLRVHSVTSSMLLGPTELEIQFSNYQLEPSAPGK